jgi:rhodanese-related sulfurtransferase
LTYRDIQADELDAFLNREDLVVIDMRDTATQSAGQLPRAQLPSDTLISALAKRRRLAPPVLVYCYHGNSSRDLCAFLSQLGLPEVYNLAGGWAAWEARRAAAGMGQNTLRQWLNANGFSAADCNGRAAHGMTPLMSSALQGEFEHTQALLAAGANPHLVNDDHHQALWFACVSGDPRLVKRLIEAGCDVDHRNVNGITCAIYAASAGKLEALHVLAEAGANLGIRSPDGFDALDSAATLPVLRYLKPLVNQAV